MNGIQLDLFTFAAMQIQEKNAEAKSAVVLKNFVNDGKYPLPTAKSERIAAKVNKSNCIPFIVLISFRLILPKSERSRKGCRSSATRTSSTEKRVFYLFFCGIISFFLYLNLTFNRVWVKL